MTCRPTSSTSHGPVHANSFARARVYIGDRRCFYSRLLLLNHLIALLLVHSIHPSIHPSRRFYYPSTLGGSILIGLNFSRSQAKQSPPPPSVFSDKTKRCCCCIGRCGPTEIKGARNRESAEERSIKNMGNNGKQMAVANFPFLPNKYLSGESARQDKTILDFYFLLLASVDAV